MQLKDIAGIGPKTLSALEKHQITTPYELLTYFPRSYRTYRATTAHTAPVGDWVSLLGSLTRPISKHTSHTTMQLSTFKDEEGSLLLRWFNSPFLVRSLSPGTTYLVRGQVTIFGGTRQIVAPQVTKVAENHEMQDEMLPIYTSLGILKSGSLRKIIATLLEAKPNIQDPLSPQIRSKYHLIDLSQALSSIHRPRSQEDLERAIKRLAFDELYLIQKESLSHSELAKVATDPLTFNKSRITNFLHSLSFAPTSAQERVIQEVLTDIQKPIAMHRLLAGEVGSGKTLVAAALALASHTAGKGTLVMAPTQILAEQLHAALTEFLGSEVSVSLITAAQKGDSQAQVVVGTQALLSPKYSFKNVGLVIVDEQHKFGVKQREYLASLSPAPHLLMMTATPIPRSLAMTIFASMEISRLDELPKNRLPIKTYVVGEEKRESAYNWINQQVTTGHNQAFVVVPLIEEAEDEEGNAKKSLKLLESGLKKRFPKVKIDIMHGKMKEAEKTEHLQAFRDGATQILVATSMVEVGIDIPGANLMVIEDAERFGLAQLHQLRGRVGRGGAQGYCLLFSSSEKPKSRERLNYFARETSGEKVATYDLEMRGPGELYGQSQSGFFNFRFASIYDQELLNNTYNAARE